MNNKKSLKIAMIGQKGIPAIYGGVERHVQEIASRLSMKGHDVTVFCRPYYMRENQYDPASDHSNLKGINIKILPTIYTKHLDAIVHTTIASVYSIFKDFDIMHYHAIGPSTLSFVPRLLGRKSFVTVHGLDWQRRKWNKFASLCLKLGEAASYHFPHRTITVSRTLKNYYDGKYNGEVLYIPNGVTIPNLKDPSIITGKYGLKKDEYILFIGRLVPEKGCHYLVEAFRKIQTEKKLVIVGAASHSNSYVEQLKKNMKQDPRIILTGNLYGDELTELFSNAYLFAAPSELEGLPIVILEALSFGQCILASDIPANMEILQPTGDQHYGFTFKNKDVSDLQNQLQTLIHDAKRVFGVRSHTRPYVEKEYNWDMIAERTIEAYYSLLDL